MWMFDHEAVERLAIGAGILGTGGSGNPYLGKIHAQKHIAKGARIEWPVWRMSPMAPAWSPSEVWGHPPSGSSVCLAGTSACTRFGHWSVTSEPPVPI